jgi:hypothetical protein
MAREVRSNRDFQPRTQDTARWAREQIKRQIGTYNQLSGRVKGFPATLAGENPQEA